VADGGAVLPYLHAAASLLPALVTLAGTSATLRIARTAVKRMRRPAYVNLLTNDSAVSATSCHPPSMVSAWPRPAISVISVTESFRFCFL